MISWPLVIRRLALRMRGLAAFLLLAFAGSAFAQGLCEFTCGDLTSDDIVDLADFDAFADCLGLSPETSPACQCADMDGSGTVDLNDFALFAVLFGQASDQTPPACTGATRIAANLTAYRPQHGTGYAPFARTAVAELDEMSDTRGPGIRINASGDVDPASEDDLIEVTLHVDPPGAACILRRSADAPLAVWTTRDKQSGTGIAFMDDETDVLPVGPTQSDLTLWVEWTAPAYGTATLAVEPLAAPVTKDTLVFHAFESIVVALGGEGQTPSDPADPEMGTFVVAVDLYQRGYDVHMYDEDVVAADGTGAAFNEVATAIQNSAVDAVAIFGYSHGGGSTYNLADLLDLSRAGLGAFEIQVTSYVDAVRNSSDIDMNQETRRPPSTLFHANQYQHGTLLEDFYLDGGPVENSYPVPTGLDVETTTWGAGCTHFEIDDFVQVRDLIEACLLPVVPRATVAAGTVDAPAFVADATWQTAIADVADAATADDRRAALGLLDAWDDATHTTLVQQLAYYAAHARRTQQALAAGAILRELQVSDDAIIAALVPLLGTDDAALEQTVRNLLGGFEGRGPGRRPDFSAYRALIAARVAAGQEPPSGLIRYLYASAPGEALLTLMRAYQLREPAELQRILWAEHVVADALWQQRNGFVNRDADTPAAAAALADLATHDAWWVRLYVAEVMAQHAAFRQPQLVARLRSDPNPLVRTTVSASEW